MYRFAATGLSSPPGKPSRSNPNTASLGNLSVAAILLIGLICAIVQPSHAGETSLPLKAATARTDAGGAEADTFYNRLLQPLASILISPWLTGRHPLENYEPAFSDKPFNDEPVYVVGIHPLHNPRRLFEVYGPLVDYIDAAIGDAHFKLEASRNYQEFDKKLDSGHFDFALPNPYQTVRSLDHGYRIFGKMSDDENFRGIILLRRDSPIKEIAELKGKAVSYPAPTALAATMMPQYFLHTHGIDVNRDIENRYVGSQESSIMNVLLGHVAAGATWPMPWESFAAKYPQRAERLAVKWQTGTLPNNGWVVHRSVPKPILERFESILFALHQHEKGRQILARVPVTRFQPATRKTYLPVQHFLQSFSKTVRSLEPSG